MTATEIPLTLAEPAKSTVNPDASQTAASFLDQILVSDVLRAMIRTRRIMVIDDEPINVKVVRKVLLGAGYHHVLGVEDSEAAIEQIRVHQPDVVLTDVMMPRVSGMQILREIKADAQLAQTPVIILTAVDDRNLKLRALELGAIDFLTKPVDSVELITRVRNTLLVKVYQDVLRDYVRLLEDKVRQRAASPDEGERAGQSHAGRFGTA